MLYYKYIYRHDINIEYVTHEDSTIHFHMAKGEAGEVSVTRLAERRTCGKDQRTVRCLTED